MSATLPFTDLMLHPLREEEFAFMQQYRNGNIPDLLLRSGFTPRQKLLLQQVALRQKAEKKLPFFHARPAFIFPSGLSVEQSSSEVAARFKAGLFSGQRFIDLTTGMGCDAYFIGQSFREGLLVEQQAELSALTAHNLRQLPDASHLQMHAGAEASHFLSALEESADLIYLDPARRDAKGGKVFLLSDCEPDVGALLPLLWKHTRCMAVKTSPLLDIDLACRQLERVKDVYILSSGSECRELLFVMQQDFSAAPTLHAVNLDREQTLSATRLEEQEAEVDFGPPSTFLYEPDVSILKAGLFRMVAKVYELQKLHVHSHLYTSDRLRSDFPGRVFALQHVLKADKKELKAVLPSLQANLSIRNFPGTVAELRKKWGLKEGGHDYLFACTLQGGEKAILHARKI